MALVLALREGQRFFVGDEAIVVDRIDSGAEFTVSRAKDGMNFAITDEQATEVLPSVFISVGDTKQASIARVAIDAPRHLRILREEAYQHQRNHLQ